MSFIVDQNAQVEANQVIESSTLNQNLQTDIPINGESSSKGKTRKPRGSRNRGIKPFDTEQGDGSFEINSNSGANNEGKERNDRRNRQRKRAPKSALPKLDNQNQVENSHLSSSIEPLTESANSDTNTTVKKSRRKTQLEGKTVNKDSDGNRKKNLQKRMEDYVKSTRGVDESSPENSHTSTSKSTQPKRSEKKSNRFKPNKSRGAKEKPQEFHDQDIRTKLISSLSDNSYECMVCWDTIKSRNQTWSCKSCWAVFHLGCTKKWASSMEKQQDGAQRSSDQGHWRCPGCQSPQEIFPKEYVCFCERVSNPELNRYQTPHSCGQNCGKSRSEDCPHPCVEPCHPGPCPPCTALAPLTSCFCGKLEYQARCLDDDVFGKACGEPCEELLGCTKHMCPLICHEGACPPCQEEELQPCYCGGSNKTFGCGSGSGIDSYALTLNQGSKEIGKAITGFFPCTEKCTRLLDCGNHICSKTCHVQKLEPGHCWRDPESLTTCHCGKSDLIDILDVPRTSCLDPIPTCGLKCDKYLQTCDHFCQSDCHEGECPPCSIEVKAECRCGSSSTIILCSDNYDSIICEKSCNQLKHCGKHRCDLTCCKASKRDSQDEEGLHICTNPCDKKLRCGSHRCQQLCHSGKCPPCLEASFDDLACHCGKTKLQAPIPCGAVPPKCKHPCTRARPCGHSTALPHNCHSDDVDCSPCTSLTTKLCRCGKKEVKFIPCFRQTPSCGTICQKMLKCGAHTCKKLCHDGPCVDEGPECSSICSKPRPGCGHPCQDKCHAPSVCSSTVPCKSFIKVPCECGFLKMDRLCSGQSIMSQKIKCVDRCLMEQRNRKIAEALGINERAQTDDISMMYDPYIFVFITPTQLKWVKLIEGKVGEFIKDPTKHVLRFNPMRDYQRKFLHVIAVNYNVKSVSLDSPPNKSVEYTRTSQTKMPSVLPSVAYKSPDKYMRVDEEHEGPARTKIATQPINSVIVKNVLLDPIITYNFNQALETSNIKADISSFGNNVVVKPNLTTNNMEQVEEMARKCFYIVKSKLLSLNLVSKVMLGWINSQGEVVWPKLDNIPASLPSDKKLQSSMNPFNMLSDSLPSLPPNTLALSHPDQSPLSSFAGSPRSNLEPSPRSISIHSPKSVLLENYISPFDSEPLIPSQDEVVDDWTQLI